MKIKNRIKNNVIDSMTSHQRDGIICYSKRQFIDIVLLLKEKGFDNSDIHRKIKGRVSGESVGYAIKHSSYIIVYIIGNNISIDTGKGAGDIPYEEAIIKNKLIY